MYVLSYVGISQCGLIPDHLSARENAKYLKFGVSIKGGGSTTTNRLSSVTKYPTAISQPLENLVYYYELSLELGSNKQSLSLQVDTGSADLWVPLKGAECINCSFQGGTFDNTTSSTYQDLDRPFSIKYGGNDTAYGTFASDQVALSSGQTVNNVTFGAIESTTRSIPIMGVSFTANSNKDGYQNFPTTLKNNGFIKKSAYSLYLTDDQEQKGEILFGGIDHAKYYGSLESFNLPTNALSVPLSSITDANGTSHDAKNTIVMLDSGTADVWLPQDIFFEVGNAISGARYDQSSNKFVVSSCSLPNDQYLKFDMGNTSINVPYSDLLLPDCTLGIESSVSLYNINILGVSLMKHAYTVFNLDDRTLSIAPIRYTSETDVQAIL